MKNNFLRFVLISFVIQSQGLEEQTVKENNIQETANAIRNTTNEIFVALKLRGVKKIPQLKEHALIHNFFITLTLKDRDLLNKISAISRTSRSNINNVTYVLIDVINELLNEDDNDIDESTTDHFVEHLTKFLTNLEYLKGSNDVNNNGEFNIKHKIINILRDGRSNTNLTTDNSDEDYSLFSDDEFWVPEESGRRIFMGDRTKIKYFPFMASIHVFEKYQCGGSIIKSDLVITAASCLQLAWNNRFFRENPAFLTVRIGSDFYKGGGEEIPVIEVYFYPGYNPRTLKNNICLLRLLRRINFRKKSKRVKKIDLDRNPSNLPMTTDGITIVGWGAKGSGNIVRDPWRNRLSFSVLDIYPLRECQDIYSKEYVTSQRNFCAGFFSKGGGACNGDVGGPGIVGGMLSGIVSFGSPLCGSPDSPTVFTKVGFYTDWIENIMEQDVPSARKRTTLSLPTLPAVITPPYARQTTRFQIEPIRGKLKPIPINQPDALRILDDENLLKEFLATMFGSKEAKEYEDLVIKEQRTGKSDNVTKRNKQIKRQKPVETAKFVTKALEIGTESYDKYTILDKHLRLDDKEVERVMTDDDKKTDNELDKNILKLIENIDMDSDRENNNDTSLATSVETHELILNAENTSMGIQRDDNRKNIDDSILTLLYLSDSEKNTNIEAIGKVIDDFDENVNEGLSIAEEGFKDLTFRDNGTGSFYNFFSKDELYQLLAEVIDDVTKNKGNK